MIDQMISWYHSCDKTMLIALTIFLISYFFISTEWIDKTVAAFLGACGIIAFCCRPGGIDYAELLTKVDINVIFLLVGMMIIVNIMAATGLFEWLAIMIARKTNGNGLGILVLLSLITAVLSAFLDNVTTVILVAPITILLAQILEIPAIPILILEAIFSNIGGTATLIGDPPNILIGSKTGLGFNAFLSNLGPCIIIMLLIIIPLIAFIFRKDFTVSEKARKRIEKAIPHKAILDKSTLIKSSTIFGLTLFGFFVSRFVHIEPGAIAITGAFIMVLVCRSNMAHLWEKIEWDTIMFFIALFVMIGALELSGLFKILGEWLVQATKGNLVLTTMVILWASAIISAIVNNIPLVMALIPLLQNMIPQFAESMGITGQSDLIYTQIEAPLYWALALGVCLGGNGTLIGASANVVVAQIGNRNKYKITFWEFTKYGAPLMFITLIISSAYVYLRYLK